MSRAVVIIPGFNKKNARLQPWRYVYEISRRFSEDEVYILTDGQEGHRYTLDGTKLTVVETSNFGFRSANKLKQTIKQLDATKIWWSVTPRTVAYKTIIQSFDCPITAFITCPFYSWRDLFNAKTNGVPYEQMRALTNQTMIPRFLFRSFLSSDSFEKIVVQSQAGKQHLVKIGVPEQKIQIVRVGLDSEWREPIASPPAGINRSKIGYSDEQTVFLYLGGTQPIRGLKRLLKSFPQVADKHSNARLLILARDADPKQVLDLYKECTELGIREATQVVGNYENGDRLSVDEVRAYINVSDVVTLPFVLVPSDVPIAVLEAMARGKPVISSKLDGIPELIEGRGVVVKPHDIQSLEKSMNHLLENTDKIPELSRAALEFMKTYPTWQEVSENI